MCWRNNRYSSGFIFHESLLQSGLLCQKFLCHHHHERVSGQWHRCWSSASLLIWWLGRAHWLPHWGDEAIVWKTRDNLRKYNGPTKTRSHIIVLNQVERTVLDIARQELLQLTDTNDSSYSCNLSSQHLLQNKGSGIREHSKTAFHTPHVTSLTKWRTALQKKTEVRKAHEWLGKVRWESDSTRCTVKNIIRSSSINLVCITRWIYS